MKASVKIISHILFLKFYKKINGACLQSGALQDVILKAFISFILGDHFYLTSSNLAATDGTSNFGDVMFTVINAPKSGIFALVDNMARPIKSFTQESRAIHFHCCIT